MSAATATITHPEPGRARLVPDIDPRQAAWLAGLAYAVLFALALFANFAVREQMVDLDDASATVANVSESETLFRLAMLSFLIVFVLDIAIAWLLHIVFRPYGQGRSLLAAWLRIAYTVFLGVAIVFMFVALRLVDSDGFTSAIAAEARDAQALLALDAFNATWMIGLVLFAFHLIVVSRILWVSGIAPRWLAAAPAIAGAVYLIDTLGYTLLSNYDDHRAIFTAIVVGPAIVTEGALTVWLLVRGHRSTPVRP